MQRYKGKARHLEPVCRGAFQVGCMTIGPEDSEIT